MSHHYIQFSDVHYSYPGGGEVLKGITFRVTHGEKVALLGLNGAGKSTLLLHTNGLLMPTQGEVNVGDVPVIKKTLPLIRQTVGMVFQDSDDQLFMPTVAEDVAFGPMNMRLPKEEVDRRVRVSLAAVGAEELASRSPATLSGGEKKRAAIATVLSMEPSILVMDEPTSGLDATGQRQLVALLKRFTHTCLIATHDLAVATLLCPRSAILKEGRIVWDGRTANLINDLETLRHFGILPIDTEIGCD